jgi:hypothetical protein
MDRLLRHVALPAIAPAALIGLYFTPVLWLGCLNRGLLAVAVALASAAGAFTAIGRAFRARACNEPADWWLLTALVLTLPLALLVGPLR